jgi:3-oxoacyl-[acyl-carrier protein] reductase
MTALSSSPSPRGRVALVTGASKGLGRAIALHLGHAGFRVVLNYRNSKEGAETTAAAIQAAGGQAVAIPADVTNPAEVTRLLQDTRQAFGPVEILINNATGPQPMYPLERYTWQDFQDQLDYFVKAPVLLVQGVLAEMKTARWGRIINVGSEVTKLGNANFSAYVAAKSGMDGLTRSWAREFGPFQITVNTVAPGWIPVERHKDMPAASRSEYARQVPLQRQGVPDDVAAAVVYLAADNAGFVTGQCLTVNGGNTLW